VLAAESVSILGGSPAGFDVRSLVVDTSPRVACKAQVLPVGGSRTETDRQRDLRRCARMPARLYAAARNPATLVLAYIGKNTEPDDPAYDPDALTFVGAHPVASGLARLALAPVVDRLGLFSLRLFTVSFDTNIVEIHDPDTLALESAIRVAQGPFALAFDPFDATGVATKRIAPRDVDGRPRYRFAYVASFTKSTVQLLDVDASTANGTTFGSVVFTLGKPGSPVEKGL
jgi:hypothetical protein